MVKVFTLTWFNFYYPASGERVISRNEGLNLTRVTACSYTLSAAEIGTLSFSIGPVPAECVFGGAPEDIVIPEVLTWVRLQDGDRDVGFFRILRREWSVGEPGAVITFECEDARACLMDQMVIGTRTLTGTASAQFNALVWCHNNNKGWRASSIGGPETGHHNPPWLLEHDTAFTSLSMTDNDFADVDLLSALDTIRERAERALGSTYAYIGTRFDGDTGWYIGLRQAKSVSSTKPIRYGLNLLGMTGSDDGSAVSTCIYGSGKNAAGDDIKISDDGRCWIAADTLSQYGLRVMTWSDDSTTSQSTLTRRARQVINAAKAPDKAYEAEVLDIDLIGDGSGHLWPGEMTRIEFPERRSEELFVASITKDDLVSEPDKITVTLANRSARRADLLEVVSARSFSGSQLESPFES